MITPEKARELLALWEGSALRIVPEALETVIAQAEQITELQSRLDGQAWADLHAEVAALRSELAATWKLVERGKAREERVRTLQAEAWQEGWDAASLEAHDGANPYALDGAKPEETKP